MLGRRPMLTAFGVLIIVVFVWACLQEDTVNDSSEKKVVECVGQVEEIQIKTSGKVLVLSDVMMINSDSKEAVVANKVLLYNSNKTNQFEQILIGNQIRVNGCYSSFETASNPGGFDEYLYYKGKHINGKIYVETVHIKDTTYDVLKTLLVNVRSKAMNQLLLLMNEDDAGLLGAMILGDKAYLPEETKELYQHVGIAHMLAISGLHISLLGAALFLFLRKYVMPMKYAVIVAVLFLFLYGEFTGFPVATTRAVIMMCCSLLARYCGRSYDPVSAIAFSGIVILIQEPYQLFQCGFLLSFGAIAGILLFQPVFEKWEIKNELWKTMLSGIPVTLTTLPIMLWFFYEISPYSIITNMVVLPFLSLLIGIGILGCAVSFIWMDAGGFLLSTAHYILKYYEAVCHFVDGLPYSRIVTGRPSAYLIILYYIVLGLSIYAALHWSDKKYMYSGAVLLVAITLFFKPKFEFLYAQLDVGQGDCACVISGEKTYIIDGGSSSKKEIGKYTIIKFLKYYGRTTIDTVFITHSDDDHTNGIVELADNQSGWNISINRIIMPQIEQKDDAYVALYRHFKQKNIKINTMKKGDVVQSNKLSFCCVHPESDYVWKSENDYSLTLDIRYISMRILATGDLEEAGENSVGSLSGGYDVLKVGHHGSKSSTSLDFLKQVSPKHAFISAGKNNRYGHPAQITLTKLHEQKVNISSTIDRGTLFAQYDKGCKKIYSYKR